VTLYATGLGPITTPDDQAPPTGTLPTPVELWVGGIPAAVSYSGRSPCCAGLDQITFTVPDKAPQGCWVPVEVRTSHSTVSNFASMAIDSKGAACSDPANPVAATVAKGGSLGMLELTRVIGHEDIGVNAPIDVTNDVIGFSATKQAGGPFAFSPFRSVPPPGTCTVYPGVGDFFETAQVSEAAVTNLDAGNSLTIAGSGSPQKVTLSGEFSSVGSYLPLYSLANQLYLSPGSYTVSGSGGADVRAFQAKITMPNPVTWTNRDQITTVDRSQPLTLEWAGASPQQAMQILGIDSDLPTDSSAMFLCTAQAGASGFTIPAEVLSSIPASRINPLASKAAIYLMPWTSSGFTASGLQTAVAAARYVLGKTVSFQ